MPTTSTNNTKENYTPEMTSEMVKVYTAATDQDARDAAVEELAARFGKGVRSIRAKLSREGVYIKKMTTNKAGKPAQRKETIVNDIVNITGLNIAKLSGLDKAPKLALETLRDWVQEMADDIADNEDAFDNESN